MAQILVNEYNYANNPSGSFSYNTQYVGGAPTVGIIIYNNGNGPGASQDSNYVTAIAAARSAGIKALGYVYTSYTSRALGTVEADIDSWYSFYTLDGIHIDNVNAYTGANFTYYQSLYNYVKGKDPTRNFVAMNCGFLPDESYMTISDTISMFEYGYLPIVGLTRSFMGDFSSQVGGWFTKYPSSKLFATVFNIPDIPTMQSVVNAIQRAGVGYINVSDQIYPNEYSTPPSSSFWSAAQTAVGQSVGGSTFGFFSI